MLAVVAILIIFGIFPGARRAYELYNKLGEERQEVADLQARVNLLASFDEAVLFEQLSTLTSAIPVDKSIPTILSTVDGVSAKTGSVFASMQLASPGSIATEAARRQTSEEAALGSFLLPFTLTVEGDYSKLRDTLDVLVTSRRLLRIKNFTLSFSKTGQGRAVVSMDTLYAPLSKISPSGRKVTPLTQKETEFLTRVANIPLLATPLAIGATFEPRPDPFSP